MVLQEYEVYVNNELENRRGRKLYANDVIEIPGSGTFKFRHKGEPFVYFRNTIKNYRNYEKLELSFEDKVNVIIGENAQGKTNLMEAIYVLAMAKSHRTSNDARTYPLG